MNNFFSRFVLRGQSTAGFQSTGKRAAPCIVSISTVKNEQDIIEPFIRHNARFVDYMVIADNSSVDQTRRIAQDCARELGNVVVCDLPGFAYTQGVRTTRIFQYCQTAFFADFCLFLDADEFIGVADRPSFEVALQRIPLGGLGLIPWQTFVIPPGDEDRAASDPPRSIVRRRRVERPLFRKAIVRLDGGFRPDLTVAQGSHIVAPGTGDSLPSVELDEVPLWHFPVRSHAQLVSKGLVGWMAYLTLNPEARRAGEGFQWREVFDSLLEGRLAANTNAVSERSLCYAQAGPVEDWRSSTVTAAPPSDYERQYSTGEYDDPVSIIGRSWEQSLTPNVSVVDLVRPEGAVATPGSSDTVFDGAWHWDHLFLDVPPFRYMAERYQPLSVLDIGCGIGGYCALFKALGAREVLGVDGLPLGATVLGDREYLVADLAAPLSLDRVFDMVVCVEVGEHLEERHSDVLLRSIARHAGNVIVFSAAEVGQPGHGHINCQPIEFWLDRWATIGWVPDLGGSLGMRCLATMSWFRRNLVALRRSNGDDGSHARTVLLDIARRGYTWYGQHPGIRQTPFSEPLPFPPEGYDASRDPASSRD